jgi:hypothetical protein
VLLVYRFKQKPRKEMIQIEDDDDDMLEICWWVMNFCHPMRNEGIG